MLHALIVSLYGETTYQVLAIVFGLYPIWLPPLLGVLFWEVWMRYIRYNFFLNTPSILLEIKLPKEITKSPVNMELALNGLYQTGGESTFIDRYWLGKTRPWFSLEIVSFGGEIHLYIWTRTQMRNTVESQMYSQFPDLEILEVDDYTKQFVYDPLKNNMWATNYALSKNTAIPLRTYLEFGLEKNPKPEFAVDPLTTLLEYLNTLKPGETMMLQIVIRAHKKEKRGGFFSKASSWNKDIANVRKKFIEQTRAEGRSTFSPEEAKIIETLNRSVVKYAFDVGIRCVYFASKEAFNPGQPGFMRGGLFRALGANFGEGFDEIADPVKDGSKHFAGWNSIAPNGSTDTDFPWQDFLGIRMNRLKRQRLDAFKRRMFFYSPHYEKTMVMTTETLATIFHFPGSYAATPGLIRIPSKRGQAPANLPV